MISAFMGYGMAENKEKLEYTTSQLQQTDSLTITIYISYYVKNGKTEKVKFEKIECTEYDIKELDKKAVRKLKKEVLRTVKAMENLDPIEKHRRYTRKIRLPTNQYLRN